MADKSRVIRKDHFRSASETDPPDKRKTRSISLVVSTQKFQCKEDKSKKMKNNEDKRDQGRQGR